MCCEEPVMGKIVRVWGLAKGRRSTKDAAPGAFTWRDYFPEDLEEGKKDFQVIIFIEREA